MRQLTIVIDAVWIVLLGWLIQYDSLVLATSMEGALEHDIIDAVNIGVDATLGIIMAVAIWDLMEHAYRIWQQPKEEGKHYEKPNNTIRRES